MKKIIFIFCLFLIPTFVFATTGGTTGSSSSGIGSFFTWVTALGGDWWNLLTVKTPSLMDRFFAWLLEYWVLLKLYGWIALVKTSWSVASVILTDLALGSQLNSLMGFLPVDVKAALVQLKLIDAIEMLVQAFIARFAMSALS